jgi:asparagine synthase (glutamine-hydrolysing)
VRQFKRFCEALRLSPLERYLDWIGIFNPPRRAGLYTDQFARQLVEEDPIQFLRAAERTALERDPVTRISLIDLQTYLPCDLMTKVDIASMAHALECRQPFLDVRLVELVASFPLQWKFRSGVGKRMMRRVFGHLLPETIWSRKKMGFGVPLDHWFRNELKDLTHDVLLGPRATSRGYFRRESVERLVRQHEQSQFDHAQRLWALLILELWMQRWCDSPI